MTRIKNAIGDDTSSTSSKTIAIVTSLVFLAAAVALVAAVWRRWPEHRRAAAVFAVVSIGYWLVRAVVIVAHDHSVGFKVVHVVLALITVGLATWVIRSASPRRSALA